MNFAKQARISRFNFLKQLIYLQPHGIFQSSRFFQRFKNVVGQPVVKMQLMQAAANSFPLFPKNGIESQTLYESRSAGRFIQVERT